MYYGDDKNKQMARSILPSKSASSAREDKANINRARRSRVNDELHTFRGISVDDALELADEAEEATIADADGTYHSNIKHAVNDRRAADKLSHFMRWAEQIVADIPVDEQLDHMRAILPDGLIGDHAISHLRWVIGPEAAKREQFLVDLRKRRQGIESVQARMRNALDKIIKSAHGRFNEQLRTDTPIYDWRTKSHSSAVRPIMGLHDIDDWIDDLYDGSHYAQVGVTIEIMEALATYKIRMT